jgi:hypothetical protein
VRTVLQFYNVYNPSGVSTLAYNDNARAPMVGMNNRRAAQRVSMKVGGRLKNPIVID